MTVKSLFEAVYRRLTAYSASHYCFLLLGALLALAINAVTEQKNQRFVPFPNSGYGVALDTKTGKSCLTDPYITRSAPPTGMAALPTALCDVLAETR